jgi:hypothetical protein
MDPGKRRLETPSLTVLGMMSAHGGNLGHLA